jgi:uncharacterized protein (TIGR03437 family)
MAGLTAATASAAPKLRLTATTVGPVSIVTGQKGPAQSVDAANVGDGTLSLSVASNVTWITPSVGAVRACTLFQSCTQIPIALNTASLTKGIYTGIVTISAPGAVDAPQTVVVTVQIGGGVPDSLDLWVAPSKTASTSFITGNNLTTSATAPGSGPSLSVLSGGAGSFSFITTTTVSTSAPAGTAEGLYKGSVSVNSSAFAPDVKNIPVNINVTNSPIASLNPTAVAVRVAQGAAKADKWIQISNTGLGTLTVSGATTSGEAWLSAKVIANPKNTVQITVDPTGQSPGVFKGTITIASNAKNGPFTVPVEMTVIAAGPPVAYFQGVSDDAIFKVGDPVSPGDIVKIVGDQFTTGAAVAVDKLPQNTVGGASVFVNNKPAPIFYTAASHVVNDGGQINFQVPYSTASGDAIVRVDRDGQRGNEITMPVTPRAPRILVLDPTQGSIAGYAIAVNAADGSLPLPLSVGFGRPVHPGEYLTIYAIGLGATDLAVTEGQAAPYPPPAQIPVRTQVSFAQGGFFGTTFTVDAIFSGLSPGWAGLYQVNVQVPANAPTGDSINLSISVDGIFSNVAKIAVQ